MVKELVQKIIDPEKTRFRRRKVRVRKTGKGGPDGPLLPSDWEKHELTIPGIVDAEVVLSSGKMKASGDDTLEE